MKKALTIIIALTFAAGCSTTDPNQKAKKGAATGAAAGAIVGAVVGHQSDNRNQGAVIGAVVGAGVGAAIGHKMDKQQRELEAIKDVEVTRTAEDEIAVTMKSDVLFDVDSSAMRFASKQTLQDMGGVFSRYPDTTIFVEGHTDSTGTDAHNQGLSDRRADSVTNFLVGSGVSPSRIVSRGYGESQPKASNDTPDGRQINRRVEIVIKAKPEQG